MGPDHERREGRRDRRDTSRPAVAPGVERRRNDGCRRRLPEPRWRRWPSIAAAAVAGVAVAVALQGLDAGVAAKGEPGAPEHQPAEHPPAPRAALMTLAEAQALHDEAAALTPVGVALDEQAQATWGPRLGRLEAAARDPRLGPEIQDELDQTLAALARVGIGGGLP